MNMNHYSARTFDGPTVISWVLRMAGHWMKDSINTSALEYHCRKFLDGASPADRSYALKRLAEALKKMRQAVDILARMFAIKLEESDDAETTGNGRLAS